MNNKQPIHFEIQISENFISDFMPVLEWLSL